MSNKTAGVQATPSGFAVLLYSGPPFIAGTLYGEVQKQKGFGISASANVLRSMRYIAFAWILVVPEKAPQHLPQRPPFAVASFPGGKAQEAVELLQRREASLPAFEDRAVAVCGDADFPEIVIVHVFGMRVHFVRGAAARAVKGLPHRRAGDVFVGSGAVERQKIGGGAQDFAPSAPIFGLRQRLPFGRKQHVRISVRDLRRFPVPAPARLRRYAGTGVLSIAETRAVQSGSFANASSGRAPRGARKSAAKAGVSFRCAPLTYRIFHRMPLSIPDK